MSLPLPLYVAGIGFWSSLLGYSFGGRKGILAGWVAGGIAGLGAATQLLAPFPGTTTGRFIDSVVVVQCLWGFLIYWCYFRDRSGATATPRLPQYRTLDHQYLEAVADGLLVINGPLTGCAVGVFVELAHRVWSFFY
jgi:hypothetical protein